jgi:membrane dipeptidase
MPVGLEDVSKYPNLFERLAQIDEPKWSTKDLKKLAGLNLIRVFKEVEKVRIKYTAILSM